MPSCRSMRRSLRWLIPTCLLLLGFRANGQTGTWTAVGPTNATVFSMAQDPFNNSVFYAGLYFGGVFKTSDLGQHWTPITGPFTTDVVFSIACDPAHRGTMYVGTFERGLFKTTDGGTTWASLTPSSNLDVESIAIDPANPNIVVAGSAGLGFRSTDGGLTWAQMTPSVNLAYFDPARPGTLYIATFSNGVMRSTDDGATFTSVAAGIGTYTVLSFHGKPDGTAMFAASVTGVFELDNGQTAWKNITSNLPWNSTGDIWPLPDGSGKLIAASGQGAYVLDPLAASPSWTKVSNQGTRLLLPAASGAVWLAAPYSGLYVASNSSGPFVSAQNGMQNYFVEAMAALPVSGTTQVFAGTDHGVFTTPAASLQWVTSPNLVQQTIFSLTPHPTLPSTVFAGTQSGGVWRTDDAGAHWASAANGMVPRQVTAVAQFYDVNQVVLAGTTNGVFQSLDQGKTWKETLLQAGVLSLATDASAQATAYVGGAGGLVLRTTDYGVTFNPVNASGLPFVDVSGLAVVPYVAVYAMLTNGQAYALFQGGISWQQVNKASPYPIVAVAGSALDPASAYMGTGGGGLYKTTDFGATWTRANNGLTGAYVYTITVDPSNASTVYAGTNLGVYKSTDKAATWKLAGSGLPASPVLSLVVDQKGSAGLTASVYGQGIYHTTDAGQTWTGAATGPPVTGPVTLAENPLFPATLYAGTLKNGMYVSTDSGAHWQASNTGLSVFVRGVVIDPSNSSTMFAASLSDGLYRSNDGGATWANIALNDRNLFGLALDPQKSGTLYTASSLGTSKSTDAGNTWQDLGQRNPYLFALVADPANPRTLYSGSTQGKVYKSMDGGQSWSEAATGLPLGDAVAVTIQPGTGTIYAAIDLNGVYRSTNGGVTWTACGILSSLQTSSTTGLSVDGNTGTLYVSGDSIGVFASTDGCQNWRSSNAGVYSANISALLASRRQSSLVFAGTPTVGLYRSTDAAKTWTKLAAGPKGAIVSLAEDPVTTGTFFAGTDTGVYRSTDSGVTWSLLGSGLPAGVGASVLLPTGGSGPVYAALGQSGLYALRTPNGPWTPVTTTAGGALIRGLASGTSTTSLYAATLGAGFISSADGGSTWTTAISAGNVQTITNVVIVDPRNSNVLYTATGGTGVQKSTDGGYTWSAVDSGLNSLYIVAMIMDPTDSNVLYVGAAQGGVYMTRDGAKTWTPLLKNLYDLNVVSLALDGSNHNILYAGTEGAGVFRMQVQ